MSYIVCSAGEVAVAAQAFADDRARWIASEREKCIQKLMNTQKRWNWKDFKRVPLTRREASEEVDGVGRSVGDSPVFLIKICGKGQANDVRDLYLAASAAPPESKLYVDTNVYSAISQYIPGRP